MCAFVTLSAVTATPLIDVANLVRGSVRMVPQRSLLQVRQVHGLRCAYSALLCLVALCVALHASTPLCVRATPLFMCVCVTPPSQHITRTHAARAQHMPTPAAELRQHRSQ